MRVGLGLEEFGHAAATLGRIHGIKTSGQWLSGGIPAQGHDLRALQQGFDRPAESSPELDLSGDGPLDDLGGQTGVEDQGIGEFDGLTHAPRVAKGYPQVKRRSFRRSRWSGVCQPRRPWQRIAGVVGAIPIGLPLDWGGRFC